MKKNTILLQITVKSTVLYLSASFRITLWYELYLDTSRQKYLILQIQLKGYNTKEVFFSLGSGTENTLIPKGRDKNNKVLKNLYIKFYRNFQRIKHISRRIHLEYKFPQYHRHIITASNNLLWPNDRQLECITRYNIGWCHQKYIGITTHIIKHASQHGNGRKIQNQCHIPDDHQDSQIQITLLQVLLPWFLSQLHWNTLTKIWFCHVTLPVPSIYQNIMTIDTWYIKSILNYIHRQFCELRKVISTLMVQNWEFYMIPDAEVVYYDPEQS